MLRFDLHRNPIVQLDQPTEMFFAVDLTELDCLVFRGGSTEQGGRCSRELSTFVRLCVNLSWGTVPQNPVLIFQIEDVSGQQAAGSSRKQCQQRKKKFDHRGKIRFGGYIM